MKFHGNAWLLAAYTLAYFGNISVNAELLVKEPSAGTVLVEQQEYDHDDAAISNDSGHSELTTKLMEGGSSYLRGLNTISKEAEDYPTSSRSLQSLSFTKKGKKSKVGKKAKKKKDKEKKSTPQECGVDYCETKQINLGGMMNCLKSKFEHNSNLHFHGDEGYNMARITAFGVSRLPAAVVYVQDVDEVKAALACAVDYGYKVSARGGNHSYQGIGTMDGYVVIDMGRTCKPDEFIIDKNDQGPHILKGSKYIGTMKAQAGCTNAVMLAMGHEHFKEEAGMTLIGSCPSVGITGFVLGGGGGDASPYIGYGVDAVKEFQIVLYDGTVVNASEEENPDLYWASRGGGGGNGIITHLTYKVIAAPKQKYEEEQGGKKFTVLKIRIAPKDLEKGAARIQEWFYDADPLVTGKFGGSFSWDGPLVPASSSLKFTFVYLGSWREAIEDLQATGLLDEDLFYIFTPNPFSFTDDAVLAENHEVLCTSSSSPCPEFENTAGTKATVLFPGVHGPLGPAIRAFQFNTYAEAEAFHMCKGLLFNGWPGVSNYSGDYCKDLGIDDDKCQDVPVPPAILRFPKSCTDRTVIDAMLDAAGDPSSFMNSHGPSPEYVSRLFGDQLSLSDAITVWLETPPIKSWARGKAGASMFPRFDNKFFAELLNETSLSVNHLQHGAALKVHPDATAFPWRNAALMVEYGTSDSAKQVLGRLVEGGYTPQGYYAYLNPFGMKKWRSYFFDYKWHKLAEIRAKYDPKDVFGKPLTIESIGE